MAGTQLETYVPQSARLRLAAGTGQAVETELRLADGTATPVELIMQTVEFAGKTRNAIAVRDLRARKLAEQQIRFLAHHGALTGLPNRSSFDRKLDQEIEAAVASGKQFAVLCLDLDRFKEVNDIYGHAAGDALLQAFARCVTDIIQPGQVCADRRR